MSRYVSVALVGALLVASGIAFAVTERLKLTPSPILGTSLPTKFFSPTCECTTSVATLRFRLRKPDVIDVEIIRGGRVVRTLAREQPEAAGPVEVLWDGMTETGAVAPEGVYRPRVRLHRERRTITLPNPITLDVTRPEIVASAIRPLVFSPDGDGRNELVKARYRLSERAHVSLIVDGRRQVLKRGTKDRGIVQWLGLVDGERVQPGRYRVQLGARDLAGNVARWTRPTVIEARSVALGRSRIVTAPGGRLAVLVVSDAARIEWRLAARRGVSKPGTLRLRAPQRPGRYRLVVTANGNQATAVVVVKGRR
ncbi:MAG: hypothetical protein U0R50_14835 [Gaiellales bacterium]